jgi:hypothetical protein
VLAARAVPTIARASVDLAIYSAFAGAILIAAVSVGRALEFDPTSVMLLSLPIGGAIYVVALLAAGDRTALALFELLRAAAARTEHVTGRSNRAQRVPKSD